MRLVFLDLYQEEVTKKGSVGLMFWFFQVTDITKSVIEQHRDLIIKKGMKNYLQQTLHINKYNVIGFIFLLPFLLMFTTDLIARIVQGDLTHYNRPVYQFLFHTPLYWTPILYTIVFVFPLLAIMVNIIPLLQKKSRTKNVFSFIYLRKNIVTLLLIVTGLGCIAIIKLHDFMPCMVQGIMHGGLTHFWQMFAYCRKA